MQELEKILEEIEKGSHTFELLGRDVDFVAIDWVRDIIHKHMTDDWVPEVEKILDKIEAEHPYKVPGKRDAYSQYNEGWQDAIDRVRGELERLNDGWVPVEDRLPEEKVNPVSQDFYEYQVTAKFGNAKDVRYYRYGNGHWWNGAGVVDKYVIAWRENPEPYRQEQPETCKYTGGSCCWPIEQCRECPKNPEKSEK